MPKTVLFVVLSVLLLSVGCQADVPRIVYEAPAIDAAGLPLADGAHSAVFRVYTEPSGGAAVWSESLDTVQVASGRVRVELGRVHALDLDWSRTHYVSAQYDLLAESTARTPLYSPGSRRPLASESTGQAYIVADSPVYEPAAPGDPLGAVPGGNWGAEIGSFEGVFAYSNGVDTGSWSSNEPYGTDGYQYQCVELARRFYRLHLGMSTVWYGDANAYYNSGPGWGLEQHPNNGTAGLPQPDDILCWDNGTWGHVAIVISSTSSTVNYLQQNVSSTTGYASRSIVNGVVQATGLQGWLHKPGNGSDPTAPVISNVATTAITSSTATITWTTDDYSTSQVSYGLTASYGQNTSEDQSSVTSHSVGLSGLNSGTLYHFRVRSKNGAGLITYASDFTFTTTPVVPGAPSVAVIDATRLTVTNNVSDPASSYYAFRINDGSACSNKFVQADGTVGVSPVWQTKSTWGTKTVTGLSASTSYTFDTAAATDGSGTNQTSNRYAGSYLNSPSLGVANKWGSGDGAATFNGTSQSVSLPGMGTELNLANGFTIECWAKPSALGLCYPVLQLTDTSGYAAWINHICFDMGSSGEMRGEVYTSGGCASTCYGNYYTSSLSFTSGSWHHYAMVVSSGGTLTFYKDGVADAGQTLLYMPSSGVIRGKVQIGRRDTSGPYYWHGSLDDVALYNYALSGSRISAHSNAADAATYNTEVVKDNPAGYWRLGETGGTAAADTKGGYSAATTQTTGSCSIPAVPIDGTPVAVSTFQITWNWNDVSLETGYRVKDTSGTPVVGDIAADTVSWTEGSLIGNTSYTRRIYTFNACGESAGSTGQTRYTLAKAGENYNVLCTTASKSTWYPASKVFTFSNPSGFGLGGEWRASSFQYKWNQSNTETWATAGTAWNSGTISLTPNSGHGWYYLHVRALNGEGVANNSWDLHYGPFYVDANAPTAVTVTDEGAYTPSLDTLRAFWTTSTDSGSGLDHYEYAVGTSASTQNITGWTTSGLVTSATISGLSLTEGQTYYLQARAVDVTGNPSSGAAANGITAAPGVARISHVWAKANATDPLSLRGKIVSWSSGSEFCLEEGDGSSAIRVVAPMGRDVPGQGSLANVAGVLTLQGPQRVLFADVLSWSGSGNTVPIFALSTKYLGGSNYNAATPGVTGGIGLYNLGLLVRIAGKVDFFDNTTDISNKYCFIEDGSGLTSSGHKGVKVRCGSVNAPTGGYATMTGVISTETVGGVAVPVLVIRDSGDISAF